MPWKDNGVEEERRQIVEEHVSGAGISDLAGIYEVSRKMIYKMARPAYGRGVERVGRL